MTLGLADYPELRPEIDRHIESMSAHWVTPIAVVMPVPWLGGELAAAPSLTNTGAGNPRGDGRWMSVVSIDALRVAPNPEPHLDDGGRLYFVESTQAPGLPEFDATGYLWQIGLSVIEVHRPRLAVAGGTVELAIGIARRTPTQGPTAASSR